MSASNVKWVRLGDYIETFDRRNQDNHPYPFMGINKDKEFMPSVADTSDLDGSKYKVISKGEFVFSGMQTGRDICIRIGLYSEESPSLLSPAYTTFSVINEDLLPEYLFLYFNRFEMDRYGAFLSDGSIRSNLDWERFCDIQIPLPDITIQKELVAAYNGLKQLAEENEALIEPLQNACQAYVVDCKAKYPMVKLGEYIEEVNNKNESSLYGIDDVKGISTDKCFIDTKANLDGVSLNSYKVINPMQFAYVADTSRRGEKIALALNIDEKGILISSIYTTFKCKKELDPGYLYILLSRSEFDRLARFNSWGSARETFDWEDMCRVEIPLPPPNVQEAIVNLYHCLEEAKRISSEAREQLKTLCPALVQRASKN